MMPEFPDRLRPLVALLGLLAYLPHPAPGGSIGIGDLPPLHGKVPAHVPDLAGPALVRYWERHEFAAALRDPGLEVRLAGALTAARDHDPARFDAHHPVIGHLIRNPAYLEKVLNAYISHPARFTYYHHHLIPVLRGLALETPVTPVTPVITPVTPVITPVTPVITPVPPDAPVPPVEVPVTTTVPGPPGLVLLGLGLAGCALARALSSRGDVVR